MPAGAHRASEERQLALLVSSAIDYAIFMLDVDGTVLTWNAGAERMKGYTREEIVGRHFSAFYRAEDVARGHPAQELRLALRDGRYEEEGWRVRKDGSHLWCDVIITPVFDEGEHVGFGKVSRDLTVRRLGQERTRARAVELEAANVELEEFRRLVSSVSDYAIFMLDRTGIIRSWNTGARRLKGWEAEEVVGTHFSRFYTPVDLARDHPARELEIARDEGRYEEEGWRVRKDGTTFWASVTITAVRDDDGVLTGFAKVTRDLTARKEADEALGRAMEELRAANRELDRFAAYAAHDLASPLTTISGFADLLGRAGLPEPAAGYARHILASSDRLHGMVQSLLTYARVGGAGLPSEPVELAEAVGQVLDDLAGPIAERHADVAVAVPGGARVMAEAGDVRLVLQNLVTNAVKFGAPERPTVAVAAERGDGPSWRVVVQDDGQGVAEADRRRIFGAFERAGAGADGGSPGHGLGLAICQRIVDRHGGTIGVDSDPGRGSRFWFTLPADPAGVPAGGA